jgi:putative nucleotidyltransferase-like protein
MTDDGQGQPREALKRVAVALKQSGLRFALAGGYAAWAHGAPEPVHDVDFVVARDDAERAYAALAEAGLRVEQPPEDWLFKVFTDGTMVDIAHRLNSSPVDGEVLDRADEVEVVSVVMPVLSATDVLTSKLNALDEHYCDYAKLLPVARALREQVDWDRVREDTAGNDFAVTGLFLIDRLGIAGSAPATRA